MTQLSKPAMTSAKLLITMETVVLQEVTRLATENGNLRSQLGLNAAPFVEPNSPRIAAAAAAAMAVAAAGGNTVLNPMFEPMSPMLGNSRFQGLQSSSACYGSDLQAGASKARLDGTGTQALYSTSNLLDTTAGPVHGVGMPRHTMNTPLNSAATGEGTRRFSTGRTDTSAVRMHVVMIPAWAAAGIRRPHAVTSLIHRILVLCSYTTARGYPTEHILKS
jgi:hypothetical protein